MRGLSVTPGPATGGTPRLRGHIHRMSPSRGLDFYPGAPAGGAGGIRRGSSRLASAFTGKYPPGCRLVTAACCSVHRLGSGFWYFAVFGSFRGSLRFPLWRLRRCTALAGSTPSHSTSSPGICFWGSLVRREATSVAHPFVARRVGLCAPTLTAAASLPPTSA